MVKADKYRKMTTEKLNKLKDYLNLELLKSKSLFGKELARQKSKVLVKGIRSGSNIKKEIARINTILHERKLNKNGEHLGIKA